MTRAEYLESVKPKPRICRYCGEPFVRKYRSGKVSSGSGSFCSRRCYALWRSENWGTWNTWNHKKVRINGYKIGAKCKVCFNLCPTCGQWFCARHGCRKYCSIRCRYVGGQLVPKVKKKCVVCGKSFYGYKTSKYCSRKCNKKNNKTPSNARRRAKIYGVEYEYINPFKVFKRDRWRCQICGKVTPKRNRGTRYSNAPELDHRIPMSKGGGHLYSNVQCACLKCNAEKSNKNGWGQFPLFGV